MAGKNGSTWKHGWTPTNGPAVLLKTKGRTSSLAGLARRPSGRRGSAGRKAAMPGALAGKRARPVALKPKALPAGSRPRSLKWVGALRSGNVRGLTVEQEYQRKEVQGRYSRNDFSVARAAGFRHPRDYQASITAHIARHGLVNAPQYGQYDAKRSGLYEGYHRYAAYRQLGLRSIPVRRVG